MNGRRDDIAHNVLFDRENGTNGGGWGTSRESRDQGAMACWDTDGRNEPISLQPMTKDEEKVRKFSMFGTLGGGMYRLPDRSPQCPNYLRY
jgi:hypothetical protein